MIFNELRNHFRTQMSQNVQQWTLTFSWLCCKWLLFLFTSVVFLFFFVLVFCFESFNYFVPKIVSKEKRWPSYTKNKINISLTSLFFWKIIFTIFVSSGRKLNLFLLLRRVLFLQCKMSDNLQSGIWEICNLFILPLLCRQYFWWNVSFAPINMSWFVCWNS